MTAPEAVLLDALREAGYSHLTPWHLRCVESHIAGARAIGTRITDTSRWYSLHQRLASDIDATGPESLHLEAQWEDARLTAARSAARQTREVTQAHADPSSNPAESRIYSREGVAVGAAAGSPPTIRVEVWRRRLHGYRLLVLRQRPVAARRGRLTWVETDAEELDVGSDAAATRRGEQVLGWVTGRPHDAGLPSLSGDEAAP